MTKAREGGLSIYLLFHILVGGAAGAVIGMALDSLIANRDILAIVTALLVVVVSRIARTIVASLVPRAPSIPRVVLINSAIAAAIGGLAGHDLGVATGYATSAGIIGLFSGLLAATLMGLLMITFYATHTADPAREARGSSL